MTEGGSAPQVCNPSISRSCVTALVYPHIPLHTKCQSFRFTLIVTVFTVLLPRFSLLDVI